MNRPVPPGKSTKVSTMKILLISPLPPPPGGITTWTEKYVEWAKDHSICAEVVNNAVIGGRATHLGSKREISSEIQRTRRILTELKRKISMCRPDAVHLNSPCGRFGIMRDYLCALAVKKKGIPVIVHFRCNIEDQINNSRLSLYFFKKLTASADSILVLNSPSKEFVLKHARRDSRQVANFIDDDYVIEQPKPISPEIRKVLFVGNVLESKGAKEIVSAASDFPGTEFILAGPVEDKVSFLNAPGNVRLLRKQVPHEEIRDLLDEADVFLFPSYTEGFSNAMLEAMARGVPIIATGVGANADMIEDSGGMLVRAGSVPDIVHSLRSMSPASVRERMSRWNVNKVRDAYLINRVMECLIGIYDEVINDERKYGKVHMDLVSNSL